MLSQRAVGLLASVALFTTVACSGGDLNGPEGPGLGPLTGTLDAGSSSSDASSGPDALTNASCSPTLTSIQDTLFTPQCALSGCHLGKTAAAGLDLTSSDLTTLLVGQTASACAGQVLVVAGDPDASFLVSKLGSHVPRGCGDPMPPGAARVSNDLLACVRGWISGLSPSDAGAPDGGSCAQCGGTGCVDLNTDSQHCGACDVACPTGSTCAGGSCQCPSGLSFCNGACVDLQNDAMHCGACTVSCGAGATCQGGACDCGSGLTDCQSACVEIASDPNNCQGCGVVCASNELCTPTGCSSTASCDALTQCGSACVDTTSSLSHCGDCNTACAAGQSCISGACVCPNSGTLCGGACVDTQTSALNCGDCGSVCPSATTCSAGTCSCDNGGTLCGSTCVDTQSDVGNCGGCGVTCGAGEVCSQGTCGCAQGPVSFSQVASIFSNNCTNAGCHSGAAPKEGLNLTASKAYANLVDVKATECSDGRKRVPSSGGGPSYLLQKLYGQDLCFGTQMPKAGAQLGASDMALIEAWICNGAQP